MASRSSKRKATSTSSQSSTPTEADEARKLAQERIDKDYDDLLAGHMTATEIEQQAAASFDKYLVSLTTGTFGLSLYFVDKLGHELVPGSRCWMIWGWSLLAGSLLSLLLSLLSSQSAFRRSRVVLDALHNAKLSENPTEAMSRVDQSNWCNALVYGLNIAAFGCFTMGALCFLVFCCKNLPKESVIHGNAAQISPHASAR